MNSNIAIIIMDHTIPAEEEEGGERLPGESLPGLARLEPMICKDDLFCKKKTRGAFEGNY